MEKHDFYDISKDFIFPFCLTLVSALVAWFVFFKQIIEERKKEKQSKRFDLKNKLTYFAMIVHNAIDNTKGQTLLINKLIKTMNDDGINSAVLSKHPLYDLKIVTEKIDIESYLISYLEFYSNKDKLSTLEEFKKIIDSAGMINDVFNQVYADLNSKHAFNLELQKKFYEQLEESADLFGKCLHNFKVNKNPLFPEMWKIHQLLNSAKRIEGMEAILQQYNLFIKPLLEFLDSCNAKKIEFDMDTGNLWVISSKATNTFLNLQGETAHHKSRLTEDYKMLIELTSSLEDSSSKLRNDFLS